MNDNYVQGFMTKCAELGLDPEALVKEAQKRQALQYLVSLAKGGKGGMKIRFPGGRTGTVDDIIKTWGQGGGSGYTAQEMQAAVSGIQKSRAATALVPQTAAKSTALVTTPGRSNFRTKAMDWMRKNKWPIGATVGAGVGGYMLGGGDGGGGMPEGAGYMNPLFSGGGGGYGPEEGLSNPYLVAQGGGYGGFEPFSYAVPQ